MKLKRLKALVLSLALGFAADPVVRLAAQGATPVVPSQQPIQATGLTLSGTVTKNDRKTPLADACLRLRKLDTNGIVARTTSDRNGAFSFTVPEPGMHVVEVVDCKNGDVLAVGSALTLAEASLTTLIVVPISAGLVSGTALLLLAAAAGAGVAAAAVGMSGDSPSIMSPEQ